MSFKKNTSGQKLYLLAYDSTDGSYKTGDASNITVKIKIDSGSSSTSSNSVSEIDSTNMPGMYSLELTQAETNGDEVIGYGSSTTSDIVLDPAVVYPSTVISDVSDVKGVVDAVLVDTNDLQTNQGQWVTATGFSTHSAADVYTTFTTGTNENAFKADVSSLSSQSSVDAAKAVVDSILVDTNELQTNQGQWATATGFSTFDPSSDAVANVTLVGTCTTNTDMVSAAPTVTQIVNGVWDETMSSHVTAGSTGVTLNGAGAAGDPWQTALPGSYTSSQAGYILNNILTTGGSGPWTSASGGSSITYVGYVPSRTNSTDITVYEGETVPVEVEPKDSKGDAVDLSSTTMYVVIDSGLDDKDALVIADGDLTKTSTKITFTVTTAVTANLCKDYRWSLRDNTTNRVYMRGDMFVVPTATKDS